MVGVGQFGYRSYQIAKKVLVLLTVTALGMAVPAGRASAADGAVSAIVLEAGSGRVLYQNNAYSSMPMASTTKILTAITVLQYLPLDAQVTISAAAQGIEGSSVYLQAGEKWSVRDLLYGLLLRSGNDCAVQLALSTAGSVRAFAVLMNKVALEAGATHSNFVNPHGLHHQRHYTTAYDMARITAYAMRNPVFCQIVATQSYTFTHCSGQKRVFVNKNKMLRGYEGANGVKTGYTRAAGRCLVSSAMRDGMQLVCVVLNCYTMWQTSAALMDSAFANYRMRCVWQAGQPVVLADAGPTPVTVADSLVYPLSSAECARLRYDFVPVDTTQSNDGRLGMVDIRLDNARLFCRPLYAA